MKSLAERLGRAPNAEEMLADLEDRFEARLAKVEKALKAMSSDDYDEKPKAESKK